MYIFFYKVLQAFFFFFFDHYCDQVMRDLPILQIQTSPGFEPRSFTTQRLAQRYASTSITPALVHVVLGAVLNSSVRSTVRSQVGVAREFAEYLF